jgi:hypothetical protein
MGYPDRRGHGRARNNRQGNAAGWFGLPDIGGYCSRGADPQRRLAKILASNQEELGRQL